MTHDTPLLVRHQQQVVRAHCQANVKRNDELDVCGKPATEAVVEHGDYVPICAKHAMIARRNHWAVGRLPEAQVPLAAPTDRERKQQKAHPTEVTLAQCTECGAHAVNPNTDHCMKCGSPQRIG